MRLVYNQLANIFTLALALAFSTALLGNDIEIRFTEKAFTEDALYIDIEVKNLDAADMIVAGQNYRMYYNTDVLALDESEVATTLSSEAYSKVKFDNVWENMQAGHVGQLDFDGDLGFANFHIELLDNESKGGFETEGAEWMTVMTLKFDIVGEGAYHLVWGREAKTDLYATAFVEIGAWESADIIQKTNITYYGDLSGEREEAVNLTEELTIAVGPNPTADYINVTLAETAKATNIINVVDLSGRVMTQMTINEGGQNARIDLTSAMAGQYIVEVVDTWKGVKAQQSVVVAK